jgi:hypothetical protein
MDDREEEGLYLLSCYWMEIAKRVVDFAIQHYKLSSEEAENLRAKYLKPGSYQIRLVDES